MTSINQRVVTERLLLQAAQASSSAQGWDFLIAAHIVGQKNLRLHVMTHCAMLGAAFQASEWREVLGQLFRLALVPLGHMLNRLPLGNTGRADVNAFKPMPIAPQHQHLIDQASYLTTL
jgi:Protein of unknown function (DUF3703)